MWKYVNIDIDRMYVCVDTYIVYVSMCTYMYIHEYKCVCVYAVCTCMVDIMYTYNMFVHTMCTFLY